MVRGLLTVLGILRLVVALADSECASLLMMIQNEGKNEYNTGYFETNTKSGGAITCTEQSGGWRTSTHDNQLSFSVCGNWSNCSDPYMEHPAAMSSMVPTSYEITTNQPVPWDCFKTTSSSFTFTAGRKGSTGARDAFMSGLNSSYVLVSDYNTFTMDKPTAPDELNFVVEGCVSFVFPCGESYGPELSASLRFGQGHHDWINNWWVGGTDCQNDGALIGGILKCGALSFRGIFHGNQNWFLVGPSDWDAYCKST